MQIVRKGSMKKSVRILMIATALGCAASAYAQTAPAKIADTAKGKVLVNEKGMTLYVFDKDSVGKSACSGTCAENWPPLDGLGRGCVFRRMVYHFTRGWKKDVGLQRSSALRMEER